jgi:hypothetical protein
MQLRIMPPRGPRVPRVPLRPCGCADQPLPLVAIFLAAAPRVIAGSLALTSAPSRVQQCSPLCFHVVLQEHPEHGFPRAHALEDGVKHSCRSINLVKRRLEVMLSCDAGSLCTREYTWSTRGRAIQGSASAMSGQGWKMRSWAVAPRGCGCSHRAHLPWSRPG